jgi:hypothetical protein
MVDTLQLNRILKGSVGVQSDNFLKIEGPLRFVRNGSKCYDQWSDSNRIDNQAGLTDRLVSGFIMNDDGSANDSNGAEEL